MRVCQFRHDGKWTSAAADRTPPHQEDLHSYFTGTKASVKPLSWTADSRLSALAPTHCSLDGLSPSRPIFLAGQNRNNFKVDNVIPAPHPGHQGPVIRRLHDLIADAAIENQPARPVDNIVGQHSPMLLVSLAHEL